MKITRKIFYTFQLDPLGLSFMVVFGVIIVIQVIGMLIHRTGTFLHIMSITSLPTPGCCRSDDDEELNKADIECKIAAAIELGRLDITEDSPPDRRISSPPPPTAPPGPPPLAQPQVPEPKQQPQKRRRNRRQRREKGVAKIVTRSRAVSRTAPTIEAAFRYRIEKMTPDEADHFVRVSK